jgi:hypothetical protein
MWEETQLSSLHSRQNRSEEIWAHTCGLWGPISCLPENLRNKRFRCISLHSAQKTGLSSNTFAGGEGEKPRPKDRVETNQYN